MPPKLPAGLSNDAVRLIEAAFRGENGAARVLEDFAREQPGSKVFGQKSLSVKKDLYKKNVGPIENIRSVSDNPFREVASWANSDSKQVRREAFYSSPVDRVNPPYVSQDILPSRYSIKDQNEERMAFQMHPGEATLPSTKSSENAAWQNLEKDPAYKIAGPGLVAGGAGAALLASENAQAAEEPDWLKKARVDQGHPDEPDWLRKARAEQAGTTVTPPVSPDADEPDWLIKARAEQAPSQVDQRLTAYASDQVKMEKQPKGRSTLGKIVDAAYSVVPKTTDEWLASLEKFSNVTQHPVDAAMKFANVVDDNGNWIGGEKQVRNTVGAAGSAASGVLSGFGGKMAAGFTALQNTGTAWKDQDEARKAAGMGPMSKPVMQVLSEEYEKAKPGWMQTFNKMEEEHPIPNFAGGMVGPSGGKSAFGRILLGAGQGGLYNYAHDTDVGEGIKYGGAITAGIEGLLKVPGAARALGRGAQKIKQGMTFEGRLQKFMSQLPEETQEMASAISRLPTETPQEIERRALSEAQSIFPTTKGLDRSKMGMLDVETGKAPPFALPETVNEFNQMMAMRMDNIRAGREVVEEVTSRPKDFTPSYAALSGGKEGKQLTGELVEIAHDGVRRQSFPIRTADDAKKFLLQAAKDVPDSRPIYQTEALSLIDDTEIDRALKFSFRKPSEETKAFTSTKGTNPGSPNRVAFPNSKEAQVQWDSPPLQHENGNGSLVSFNSESGAMRWIDYDSPAAQVAALNHRNIIRIPTDDGVKFAQIIGGGEDAIAAEVRAGKTNPSKIPSSDRLHVIPLDASEGLPTIRDGMEINSKTVLNTTPAEYERALQSETAKTAKVEREIEKLTIRRDLKDSTVHPSPVTKPPRPPRPPPPEVPPGPASIPPSALGQLYKADRLTRLPSLLDKVIGGLFPASFRLKDHMFQFALAKESAKSLEGMRFATYAAFDREMGGLANSKQFTEDLKRSLLNDEHIAGFERRWADQMPPSLTKMVDDFRVRRDLQDKVLNELTGGAWQEKVDLRDAGMEEKYLRREYLFKMMKQGEFADMMQKDQKTWEAAKNKFMGEFEMDEATAEFTMKKILGSSAEGKNAWGEFVTTLPAPKSANALKRREEQPYWFRQFLGENADIRYTMASSDAAQAASIARLSGYRELAKNPRVISEAPVMGWVLEQSGNKMAYGDVAGKWIHPDAADYVLHQPKAADAARNWAQLLSSHAKGNLVVMGSATTWVNTMMGNMLFSGTLSGGIKWYRPVEMKMDMAVAIRALLDHRKNPLSLDSSSSLVRTMMDAGALQRGTYNTEIGLLGNRLADQALERILKSAKPNWTVYDLLGAIKKTAETGLTGGRARDVAGGLFDSMDKIAPIMAFHRIVEDSVAKGTRRSDAIKMAAEKINLAFPMTDRVGTGVETAAKYLGGIAMSPFLRSISEVSYRIPASVPLLLKRDPSLAFKWAGTMGLFAAIGGGNGILRRMNGISDEEVEYAMKARSPLEQSARWGTFALPFRVGGRVALVDATQWLGPSQYFKDNPDVGPMMSAVQNVTRIPFMGSQTEPWIADLWGKLGMPVPEYPNMPTKLGGGGVMKALDDLHKSGAAPTFPQRFYENAKATGAIGEQTYRQGGNPPWTAVVRGMGLNVSAISTDPNQMDPRALNQFMQVKNIRKEFQSNLRYLAMQPAGKSRGMWTDLVDKIRNSDEPDAWKEAAIEEAGQQMKKKFGKVDGLSRLNEASDNSRK